MALISVFVCDACGEKFSLNAGLLQKDLTDRMYGDPLPGGAKLPDKESYKAMINEKSTQQCFDFNNALMKHMGHCKGNVTVQKVVFAH